MNICHEEINTRGELSRHGRSRITRSDRYSLVQTPSRQFLPDVVYARQERLDRSSVDGSGIDGSDIVQEELVSNDNLAESACLSKNTKWITDSGWTYTLDHVCSVGLQSVL